MEDFENEEESIKTIFQQWSQEEIRLFYQKIWQKESQEYETEEIEERIQLEDEELWQQSMSERIVEEESDQNRFKKPQVIFKMLTSKLKKKLQRHKVNKHGVLSKQAKLKIKG